ncbi:hypothetical protein EV368DRAFT_75844 [Lentinula lateritia]|nr:hypothetical protein EV368DRAFT_75844 [Lentinula lateritia]
MDNLPKIYKMSLDEQFYIIAVQTKAYSIYHYPCIGIFECARLRIARLPAYPDLLKLGQERNEAIFLDLACCFGNDARKAIQDGYPIDNVIASDIHKDFWDLGHEMFKSTPKSFPVPFVQGDIFDTNFLEATKPFTVESPPTKPVPTLNTLTSLNLLCGHLSACFCGAFFHLFGEDGQKQIAEALNGLLSPKPVKGFWHPTGSERYMFCHSPESWKDLWEGLFGKGNVDVKAQLRKEIGDDLFGTYPGNKDSYHVMDWSVSRI